MQSTTSPTQRYQLHLPEVQPDLTDEALRTEDQELFHLLWRKCLNITRLHGGEKIATLPPDLPVERLVISHGEILNTSKSQISEPGRSKTADNKSKEKV